MTRFLRRISSANCLRQCGTAPRWLRPGPRAALPAAGTSSPRLPWRPERPSLLPEPGQETQEPGAMAPELKAPWGHHSCLRFLPAGDRAERNLSILSSFQATPAVLLVPARPTQDPEALRRLKGGGPRSAFGRAAKGTGRASRSRGKFPTSGSPGSSRWEEAPPCPGRDGPAASRH